MGLIFDKPTMVSIRKVLKKYNTCVLAILILYDNKKKEISKVLGSVIYCTTDNYICVYHLCLYQDQLYLVHKGFKNKTFNDISVIGIPELLMNIMFCH